MNVWSISNFIRRSSIISNYLSSPIRIIDRSISRNRLISWSSILQKYADPAGTIATYPLSSSLFVPLENYHLVTILGAAPSITYPRGQACARHSLLCASISLHSPLSRLLIPFFSFALAFLLNCARGIAWFHSINRLFVKRGIVSTISERLAQARKRAN